VRGATQTHARCSRQDTQTTCWLPVGSQEKALIGTDRVRDLLEGPDLRGLTRRMRLEGRRELAASKRSRSFSRSQHASELRKRVELRGIRTPDLLHAIQAQSVARRRQASLCVPAACSDCGWMWPGAAGCLVTLAPKSAPSQLISTANILQLEQEPARQSARATSSRTRADDRMEAEPPSDDVRGNSRALPSPPARRHGRPRGRDHRR
jgi:hypothetical protein